MASCAFCLCWLQCNAKKAGQNVSFLSHLIYFRPPNPPSNIVTQPYYSPYYCGRTAAFYAAASVTAMFGIFVGQSPGSLSAPTGVAVFWVIYFVVVPAVAVLAYYIGGLRAPSQ